MSGKLAQRFFHAWGRTTAIRAGEVHDLWHNCSSFTTLVKGSGNCIIDAVAKDLGLYCYSEYYSVDAVFYTEDDLVPERATGQTWLRAIRIAFEHENEYNTALYQEISHLLILHAELSVIVTYPPSRDLSNLPYMDHFHSLIQGSPRADELDANENFLLIFGYREPLEWKGLVYKNKGWEKITEIIAREEITIGERDVL